MRYDAIPGVVYTHPELAGVGASEAQLQAAGRSYRTPPPTMAYARR